MLYKELLEQKRECPFCGVKDRIIKETPMAYLTYALAPYTKHHLLIVPKRHLESLHDITRNEMDDVLDLQHFGMGLLQTLGYRNATALVREGEKTGRSVNHLHFHIIPEIRIGDLDHDGNERRVMDQAEIESVFVELKKAAEEQESRL